MKDLFTFFGTIGLVLILISGAIFGAEITFYLGIAYVVLCILMIIFITGSLWIYGLFNPAWVREEKDYDELKRQEFLEQKNINDARAENDRRARELKEEKRSKIQRELNEKILKREKIIEGGIGTLEERYKAAKPISNRISQLQQKLRNIDGERI